MRGGGELFHNCSVHISQRFPWKGLHDLNVVHRIFSPFLNQCCCFPPQLHLERPSVKPNLLLSRLEDSCQQGRGCVGPETLAQTESSCSSSFLEEPGSGLITSAHDFPLWSVCVYECGGESTNIEMVTIYCFVNTNNLRVNVMNIPPFCNSGYKSGKYDFNDLISRYLKITLEGILER